MPKLSDDVAKVVSEAESSGGIMEEGWYEADLIEVQDKKNGEPMSGPNGPYWQWVFKLPADAERYAGWQQWLTTSLSERAAFKMNEVFAAFGADPSTDTDELVGKRVRIQVGTRTVQDGAAAGELRNTVKRVAPLDGDATPLKGTESVTGRPATTKGTDKNLF